MKAIMSVTIFAAGLAIISVVAASSAVVRDSDGRSHDKLNISYREKTQSRVPALTDDNWRATVPWIEEAQMIAPPPIGERPFDGSPHGMPPFGLEPPFDPMTGGPFGPPSPPTLAPRAGCEREIDLLMAHVAYLKSEMRLQGDQKEAWYKVEQTAEPSLEKLRDLCETLPSQPTPPPAILEALDFAEKQLTARLDLLRAVRGPMQELYNNLSPDQRALLAPPLPR